jgi:cytochrome d ubiquinol oxidase subunit II
MIKVRKALIANSYVFITATVLWVSNILLLEGHSVNEDMLVSVEKYKYLHNILEMPLNTGILVIGLSLVIIGIYKGISSASSKAIWYSGVGSIMLVFSIFLLAGFNHTCFYPSTVDIQSSLSIRNASSSHYTLRIMSYVSLMVPFIIAYIWFAWRALNKEKISSASLEKEDHKY